MTLATVAIPGALHDALKQWAEMGFEDFGDFFFDLGSGGRDVGKRLAP